MKTVSIVMCTYNGARYLREQMDSLEGQTYPVVEIIAQDDGSSDATLDILREYAAKDSRIKIYQTAIRGGRRATLLALWHLRRAII